jgi:hypothetical protein
MMSEVQRVVDQLRRAFEGDAFHGESVNEILRRVTAVQANRRPIKQAHSIWELVHHIAGWNGEISNRLKGQAARLLPPEQNFPDQKDTSEAAWKKTLQIPGVAPYGHGPGTKIQFLRAHTWHCAAHHLSRGPNCHSEEVHLAARGNARCKLA